MNKEFKVVLAGDFGSGRTTYLNQFVAAKRGRSKVAAVKAEISPLELHTSAGAVSLKVYDSFLHAKGGLPDQGYYRNGDACLLFFDVTSEASYNNLEKHYTAFADANRRSGQPLPPIIVVGAKIDKPTKEREVKAESIDWPRKKGLEYIEVSAKANWNVKEALLMVLKGLLGDNTQLTTTVELAKAEAEVDEAAAEAAEKAYAAAA